MTLSDYRRAVDQGQSVAYFSQVASASEYYPFGMLLTEGNYSSGSYRFGFNGKEMDNDFYGEGNIYDYGFRIYNPRIAKFLSVDPLASEYPEISTYQYAENRPIKAIDIDGLEAWDGPNDVEDVFSLQSYLQFANAEIQRLMDSDDMIFDCADLALYIYARYHQHMKAEMKYKMPGKNIYISSNDKDFKSFEDFYKGIKGTDGIRRRGLRGEIGAKHLYDTNEGWTVRLDAKDMITGDLVLYKKVLPDRTIYHTQVLIRENDKYDRFQANQVILDEEGYHGDYPTRSFYFREISNFNIKIWRWKAIQESPMGRTSMTTLPSLGVQPIKTEENTLKPKFENR